VNRELGHFGEAWAAGYLTRLGFEVVDRNVRYRGGEIDLVARDRAELVFVEVKCRRTSVYGPPEASITRKRYEHMALAVAEYLSEKQLDPASYRIDVIALVVDGGGRVASCNHLKAVEPPAN
jgi:putative endonuclease